MMYPSEVLLKSRVQPCWANTLVPEACGIFAVTAGMGFAVAFGRAAGGREEFSVIVGEEDASSWEAGACAEEGKADLSVFAPEEADSGDVPDAAVLLSPPCEFVIEEAPSHIVSEDESAEDDSGKEEDAVGGNGVVCELHAQRVRKNESRTRIILFSFIFSSSHSEFKPLNEPIASCGS